MSNTEYYEQEIKRYSKQLEVEREKEEIQKVAEKTFMIYKTFNDAGFDEERAWWVALTILQKTIDQVFGAK